MKKVNSWRIVLLVVVAFSFTASAMYAQRRRGPGKGMPRYDRATEVTMSGTVEKVESQIGKLGWNGTHLVVRFAAETLTVHLGPSSYLSEQRFAFAEGEQIEVSGSRLKFEGRDVLVAREIKKDGRLLTLRNRQGIPAWSRSRWRY